MKLSMIEQKDIESVGTPFKFIRFCCDCGAPRDLVKPVTKKLATRTAMEENSLFSGGHHQTHHAIDEFCDQRETTR